MLSRRTFSRLLRLANRGDIASQFELAELLRQDDEPDYAMAAYWYRKAAEQGDPEAQNNLGTLYQQGLGVEQDDTEAVLWYRLAAEQGEPIAQYNLATRYRLGEGVPLDMAEATKWLARSAEQGYVDAISDLGVTYQLGHGVPKNISLAAALCDEASMEGDVTATVNLSSLFDELESTARSGDPYAQYMVGVTYWHGQAKPQDSPLAFAWMSHACEHLPDDDNSQNCREETSRLGESLSDEERERAQRLLHQLRSEIQVSLNRDGSYSTLLKKGMLMRSTTRVPGQFIKAVAFAAEKHRNQRRKDADASPYINHPIALAHVLANDGGVEDVTVLCAAVLHDTIEDTETTTEELTQIFGSEVASIVLEVTDDKSLEKHVRKQQQIEHASHLSPEAKLVKLADKICNLRDILASPPAGWSAERKRAYFDWAAQVVAGVRGIHPRLEAVFDGLLARHTELR